MFRCTNKTRHEAFLNYQNQFFFPERFGRWFRPTWYLHDPRGERKKPSEPRISVMVEKIKTLFRTHM